MNKNRKVIKFQRKQILISNPLAQQDPKAQQKNPKQSKQSCSSQFSNYPTIPPPVNDKLEIPKQMKMENIANILKNKFIAMMDSQPLMKIDTLFENEVVCKVTGSIPKKNRESFGKKNNRLSQLSENVNSRNISNEYYEQNRRNQFSTPLVSQQKVYPQSFQTNYLDLISQGVPLHHYPLEQAFESEVEDDWTSKPKPQSNNYMISTDHQYEQRRQYEPSLFERNPFS